MTLFLRTVFILIVCVLTLNVKAQTVNPVIDSLIGLITVEGYREHFDSLMTGPKNIRKVIPGKQQHTDHDACRDYIFRQFQHHLGIDNSYLHHFDTGIFGGLANVIAFKAGTNRDAGIWVVSAHYDSNNSNERFPDKEQYSPGANDNGTGVAAILEMARIFSGIETEASIVFAVWDFEEQFTNGFPTGSNRWFTDKVSRKNGTEWDQIGSGGTINIKELKGNINFDMFGNPQLEEEGKPLLWACYASNQHIEIAENYAQTLNLYVPEIETATYGRLLLSDHYTFAARKIPALVNLESGYLDDPFYHTAADHHLNPQNINFSFATKVTQGGLAFVLEQTQLAKSKNNGIDQNTLVVNSFENQWTYFFESPAHQPVVFIFDAKGQLKNINTTGKMITFSPTENGLFYFQTIGNDGSIGKVFKLCKKEASNFIYANRLSDR